MTDSELIAKIKEIESMLDESAETRIMIIHQLITDYENSEQSSADPKDSRTTDL